MEEHKSPESYSLVSIPRELTRREYDSKEIISIIAAYTEVMKTAGWIEGNGAEIDAPYRGALERLIEAQKKADLLPLQIRETFPEPFELIEETLSFLQKRK